VVVAHVELMALRARCHLKCCLQDVVGPPGPAALGYCCLLLLPPPGPTTHQQQHPSQYARVDPAKVTVPLVPLCTPVLNHLPWNHHQDSPNRHHSMRQQEPVTYAAVHAAVPATMTLDVKSHHWTPRWAGAWPGRDVRCPPVALLAASWACPHG